MGIRQPLDAFHHRVEQHTKQSRAFSIKCRPQFRLGPASFLRDGFERQEHGTVGKVGPRHNLLDAVQDHRTGRVEQHLVLIGVKLSNGETSAGGASRIAAVLAEHKPAIVVLALGANDGLRGLTLAQMRENLSRIISASQRAGAKVLVAGMKMPPNYGPAYTREFEAAFNELARQRKVAVVPFLLAGMESRRDLFQPDNIHPVAAAQPMILETVWKSLTPLL